MSSSKVLYHLYVEKETIEKIKRLAHQKSIYENRRCTITELVAKALEMYDNEEIIDDKDILEKNSDKWSCLDTSLLLNLRGAGHNFATIGKKLGRSDSACRNKYRKLVKV